MKVPILSDPAQMSQPVVPLLARRRAVALAQAGRLLAADLSLRPSLATKEARASPLPERVIRLRLSLF